MGFIRRKILSLFVVVIMLVSLLPISLAHADASLYFNFTNFSTIQTDPTQVNTGTVELDGTFNGVSANSLTYQVDQLVNGQVVNTSKGTGVAPIITNGNTFSFANVQLFQGLNQITVFGTNPNGNQVSGTCYVQFSDVPVIYNVTLVDGRQLQAGVPLIVDSANTVLTLKAPNADQVTVNGHIAYASGQGSFIVSNLTLTQGLNDLSIVASNSTQTYSLDRQLVFYNGVPTGYGTEISDGTTSPVSLEGYPTVGPNQTSALQGQVKGKIVFAKDVSATLDPTIKILITDSSGNLITDTSGTVEPSTGFPATIDPNSKVDDGVHVSYSYTTTASVSITQNGNYMLTVGGQYGTSQNASYQLPFVYRSSNTPYITAVNQVYNPRVIDTTNHIITYDSSTVFPDNSQIFELPIWLVVKAKNFDSSSTVTLSSVQNGQTVSSSLFTYDSYTTSDGDLAFKITNMPSGDQMLQIHVDKSGNGDTKTIPVNYIPAPYIQLDNIYSGKVYNSNGTYPADEANPTAFTTIKGRLINFNLTPGSPDLDTVKLTINGKTVPLNDSAQLVGGAVDSTGHFEYIIPSDMQLVGGPNSFAISGTANGVPVTTKFTVYLFSSEVPVITSIAPVPTGTMADTNLLFRNTGQDAYSTNEKQMDVLFSVNNADTVLLYVDGKQIAKASKDPVTGTLVPDNPTLLHVLPSSSVSAQKFDFDFVNDQLPKSGLQSVVVQVSLGTQTISQTLSVTRELSPYIIKSPKLPDESVINQNFVDVEIQAEGANQVLIGKTPATKDNNDNFRLEVRNLKPGINKIKFTVVTGPTTIPGEIDVDYAGTSTIGAQYKTTIPSGGSVKVFNGDLSLKIPKATMLRQANQTPGQDPKTIDMFDSQQVLFGIADRTDGRTLKRYNNDGQLTSIDPQPIGVDMLHVPSHFGYASPLYWIDAGYFDTASPQYDAVDGLQPYESGLEFYARADKWMELTQRGTITIQYDPSIRDVISKKLSIWKFTNNNWQNIGGVVDNSKHTVTASFQGFGYYAVFEDAYSFSDIIGHPYARDDLELMFAKGIMQPEDNNNFGVYDNITRGEFATMLVKALDLPLEYDPNNLTFDDVPPVAVPGALWDYRYIETAVRAGIISGMQPRVFNPSGYLTREQAATMIARAMNLKLGTPEKDIVSLDKSFTDANTIDYYARTSVLAVNKAGIMNGEPNTMIQGQKKQTYRFDPTANLNRADASIIAVNVMTKLKRL